MKLLNFSLIEPTQGVILKGHGLEWDLHNFVSFSGLFFDASKNTLRLEWIAPALENPWGCFTNKSKGCHIVFYGVTICRIGPSTNCPKFEEIDTLHGISKVTPEMGQFRFKADWSDSEPFNLLFEFGNGWSIEIASERAELIQT